MTELRAVDEGAVPASAPATSRLFVLPIATRRWVSTDNTTPPSISDHWTMYFDGSLKLGGGGAGVLFISPKGEQLKYVFKILFEVSNNEAEYEALLHGLRLAISLGIK